MSISLRKRIRQACLLGCVSGAAILGLTVGQAPAATTVYPGGGSTFTGGTEGWFGTGKECKLLESIGIGVLCESEVEYSPAVGNPPGSLDAHTKVTLNLLKLAFNSKATLQSPDFTVTADGPATLHLDRQFASAGLLNTGAQASYKVTLLDKTANTTTTVTQETIEATGGFVGKDAAVTVTAGHTYAVQIQAETTAAAALGLTSATADLRFDNIAITVSASGESGAGGKGGSGGQGGESGVGGISSARLESLIRSASLAGPAVLKGNRLAVRARCPARIGATCTLSLQGVLNRHQAATTARRARVKQGKAKRFVLKVKPSARNAVRAKQQLLFKETVRVGKARATVYKHLQLVRR